jgi:hypothetical protein
MLEVRLYNGFDLSFGFLLGADVVFVGKEGVPKF